MITPIVALPSFMRRAGDAQLSISKGDKICLKQLMIPLQIGHDRFLCCTFPNVFLYSRMAPTFETVPSALSNQLDLNRMGHFRGRSFGTGTECSIQRMEF